MSWKPKGECVSGASDQLKNTITWSSEVRTEKWPSELAEERALIAILKERHQWQTTEGSLMENGRGDRMTDSDYGSEVTL